MLFENQSESSISLTATMYELYCLELASSNYLGVHYIGIIYRASEISEFDLIKFYTFI